VIPTNSSSGSPRHYYCIVTLQDGSNTPCSRNSSEMGPIQVISKPTIISQPNSNDVAYCEGSTPSNISISLTSSQVQNVTYHLQWYTNTSPTIVNASPFGSQINTNEIPNGNYTSTIIPANPNGTPLYYFCLVKYDFRLGSTTHPVGCFIYSNFSGKITKKLKTQHTTTITQCDGSYTWPTPLGDGNTYTASGTYSHTSTNSDGCNHTETLVLTINQSTQHTTNIIQCDGSYTWAAPLGDGNTYSTSGTYTHSSTNSDGCEHTETLDLTINQSSQITIRDTICIDSLPYIWNGNSYNSAGTYTYTTSNINGCDSIVTLILLTKVCHCEDPCSWSKTGNDNISSSNYIGTINAANFVIKTANTTRIIVPASGISDVPFGTTYPALLVAPDGTLFKSHSQLQRTANTTSSNSQKEIDELKLQVSELQTQVKALLEARNYSTPCKVETPKANTLEVVPTPFANNAKAIYSIDNFNGEASLQVADLSGKVLKSFTINQAKGQIEIGTMQTSTSTVVFTIVSGGKLLVSKKSIKTND
ncbi:MAG: hypothetical protein ACOVO1_12655, partial [Chitinophagaceae bacterium]